ncbi:hypothetical protein NFI96_020170 [Prochilodus magdalenae]|nr:hypothetical protein NFI96_020170 [Prochilodus magdalenae]
MTVTLDQYRRVCRCVGVGTERCRPYEHQDQKCLVVSCDPARLQSLRAFTLIVELWHWDNSTAGDDKKDLLIERSVYRREMNPGDELQMTSQKRRFQYSVSVRCDRHYYSSKCNKQCRPRDDYFGHYECDHLGNQQCLEGWTGPDCMKGGCLQSLAGG